MQISYLFPSPIWVHDFESAQDNTTISQLANLASQEVEQSSLDIRKSNRGNSVHTQENFLGDYPDSPLHALITPLLAKALADYEYDPTYIVSVSYWSIISYEGAYNERHHHPHSLLSGVLYADTPEGSGALVFTEPRYGKLMENRAGRNKGALLHKDQRITPKSGRLVIFPSYLEHQVDLTTSKVPRIIYSFNVQMIKPASKEK